MKRILPEDSAELARESLNDPRTEHSPMEAAATLVVGDVVDTHHPSLPGRVLVRWLDERVTEREEWLEPERHLSLVNGDRVLVTRPTGWRQWIVTGALGRGSGSPSAATTQVLRLGPNETLSIQGHDGNPLLTLHQGPQGLKLELSSENLEVSALRTLRLSAHTIEIVSADGGITLRTEGETVVRAKLIHLN
jgi:hypothetical protein